MRVEISHPEGTRFGDWGDRGILIVLMTYSAKIMAVLLLVSACGSDQVDAPWMLHEEDAGEVVGDDTLRDAAPSCTPGSDSSRCELAQCYEFSLDRSGEQLTVTNGCPHSIFIPAFWPSSGAVRTWAAVDATTGVPIAFPPLHADGRGCAGYLPCPDYFEIEPGESWGIFLPTPSFMSGEADVCHSEPIEGAFLTRLRLDTEIDPLPFSVEPSENDLDGGCFSTFCERQAVYWSRSPNDASSCFETPNQVIYEGVLRYALGDW